MVKNPERENYGVFYEGFALPWKRKDQGVGYKPSQVGYTLASNFKK